LTPPVTHAGLYRGLSDLKASLDRWRGLEPESDAKGRVALEELIQAQAAAVELAADEPAWIGGAGAQIERIHRELLELEYTLIPHGLHIVGVAPTETQRTEMLDAAGVTDAPERQRLDALLAVDSEIPAILHALDGGYLRPAPGGDLMRTTDILPTGRNLHGLDPFRIPSAFAVRDGAQQADRLLARFAAGGQTLPETVAMVLWGTDNLKTEGGPIAQVLWLLGAEPRHDSYGRLCGAQLIPLDRLGRPRVDVIVTLSGIFRDLLPLQTKLLAEAALLAASRRRAGRAELCAQARADPAGGAGRGIGRCRPARVRQCRGGVWANVNQLVDHGAWNDEDELAEAYVRRKGFAYGPDGKSQARGAVLRTSWRAVDVAYQNLDSIELGVTTVDHYFDTLGGISRAVNAPVARRRKSILATRRAATGPCAASPNRSRWRRAPAPSTPSGTRRCWNTAMRASGRSRRR
jgi:magnesium chelatase subunit H